jgi:hypothetical protein
MAAGAITKAATATPSSAAERSIEVALTDITGLLVAGYCDSARMRLLMLFRSKRALSVLAAIFLVTQFQLALAGLMKLDRLT